MEHTPNVEKAFSLPTTPENCGLLRSHAAASNRLMQPVAVEGKKYRFPKALFTRSMYLILSIIRFCHYAAINQEKRAHPSTSPLHETACGLLPPLQREYQMVGKTVPCMMYGELSGIELHLLVTQPEKTTQKLKRVMVKKFLFS